MDGSTLFTRSILPLWKGHFDSLLTSLGETITHISGASFNRIWEALKQINDISADEIDFIFTEIMLRAIVGRMLRYKNRDNNFYVEVDLRSNSQYFYTLMEPKLVKFHKQERQLVDKNEKEDKDDVKEQMKKLADYHMLDEIDVMSFFESCTDIIDMVPLFFDSSAYRDEPFKEFLESALAEDTNPTAYNSDFIQRIITSFVSMYKDRPDPSYYWDDIFDLVELLEEYEKNRKDLLNRLQRTYYKSFEPDKTYMAEPKASEKKMIAFSSKIFKSHEFLLPKRVRVPNSKEALRAQIGGMMGMLIGDTAAVEQHYSRDLEGGSWVQVNNNKYPNLPKFKFPQRALDRFPEDEFTSIKLTLSVLRYCDAMLAYSLRCYNMYNALMGLSLKHYQAFPVALGLGFVGL